MRSNQTDSAATTDDAILHLRGITKTFPGVKALDDVSLDVRRGEVHALLGENGAGKSTLMKILAGTYTPDAGEILLGGNVIRSRNPLEAKRHGILLVHQELSLVPGMTVAENIYLGSLPSKALQRVDWNQLHQDAQQILDRLGCAFGPTDTVESLSIANQQMVEIARALAFDPQIVVFDEPTSSLTEQEKVALFKNIRQLQDDQVAIVYISHRMDEIFELSDRITVLRDGRHRGTVFTDETNELEVTRLMIGRDLEGQDRTGTANLGDAVLTVENLARGEQFKEVSFTVHAGEVVGFYGLVGAGRTEVAEAVFGLRTPESGSMQFKGQPYQPSSPVDAIQGGMALIPEDRKQQGLILSMSVIDNMTLPQIDAFTTFGFITTAGAKGIYDTYQDRLDIKTPGPDQVAKNLSGGNQQKIVLAKWLARKPALLILDEPTRGIDVGSKSEIHRLIRELAAGGMAVMVISSEMPEILTVSDRILTMHEGRITAELDAKGATEDDLIAGSIGKGAAHQPTTTEAEGSHATA